jgi:hypothetical protein
VKGNVVADITEWSKVELRLRRGSVDGFEKGEIWIERRVRRWVTKSWEKWERDGCIAVWDLELPLQMIWTVLCDKDRVALVI